jgi:two-component system sensor histidine kinase UhpB
MNRLKLLCILLLVSAGLYAQKKNLDSLEKVLSVHKNDTICVNTLNEMAYQLKRASPRKAFSFATEAKTLAQHLLFKRGEGEACNNLGNIYDNLGMYDSSLYFHNQSLSIYEKIDYRKGIASCYNNIGEIYREKGDATSAVDFYLRSLEIKKALGDKKSLSSTYNNLGAVYSDLGDFGKSLEYHLLSLRIKEEIGDKQKIGSSCQNVGLLYHQLGNDSAAYRYNHLAVNLFLEVGDSISLCQAYLNQGTILRGQEAPEETFASFRKAIGIAERQGLKKQKISAYNNMINFFSEQKQYDSALVYSRIILDFATAMKDSVSLALIEHNLGQVYLRTGKFKEALREEKTAEAISRKKNNLRVLRDVCLALSELYEHTGELTLSLQYQREYSAWSEKIFNEATAKKLGEQQARFESDKRQREILALKQKEKINSLLINGQNLAAQKRNVAIAGLGLCVALLLISLLLFISRRRAIIRAREEKAALAAEEQERMRIARDIHDDLGGGLTRITILSRKAKQGIGQPEISETLNTVTRISHELTDNMRDLVWALHPENASLNHLVARIREFVSDFYEEMDIKVQKEFPSAVPEISISKELLRNVFLVVKEIVNNIAKHAGADEVLFRVSLDAATLKIAVSDNGKGFDVPEQKEGNGVKNMKNRVGSVGGNFNIKSGPGGTTIEIEVPFK